MNEKKRGMAEERRMKRDEQQQTKRLSSIRN